jgi:endonuclease/exonuclease/phosphatase family metal-dependent hydrolase
MTTGLNTTTKTPLRLHVGTFNAGHFNQGEVGGYQGEDVQEELERWRQWIGQQSMDLFFIQEWDTFLDKGETVNATDSLLTPYYQYTYFGQKHIWIYNGIATNLPLTNLRQVDLSHPRYYAVIGDLQIGTKTITLMSVHVPWQEEYHESSMAMLIEEMSRYEYLICAGDINARKKNQLRFLEAGFRIANGGDEGWHCTGLMNVEKEDMDATFLDNIIITPNLQLENVSAPQTSFTKKDHLPLLADVIIP